MNLKKAKQTAKESTKERFQEKYPDLQFKIGKQSVCKQGNSLHIDTEIIVKKQTVVFGDSW